MSPLVSKLGLGAIKPKRCEQVSPPLYGIELRANYKFLFCKLSRRFLKIQRILFYPLALQNNKLGLNFAKLISTKAIYCLNANQIMLSLHNIVHCAYRVSQKKCPQDCLNTIFSYKHARWLRHISFEMWDLQLCLQYKNISV